MTTQNSDNAPNGEGTATVEKPAGAAEDRRNVEDDGGPFDDKPVEGEVAGDEDAKGQPVEGDGEDEERQQLDINQLPPRQKRIAIAALDGGGEHARLHLDADSQFSYLYGTADKHRKTLDVFGYLLLLVIAGAIIALGWTIWNSQRIGAVNDRVTELQTKVDGQTEAVTDAAAAAKASQDAASQSATAALASQDAASASAIRSENAQGNAELARDEASQSAAAALTSQDTAIQAATAATASETNATTAAAAALKAASALGDANKRAAALEARVKVLEEADKAFQTRVDGHETALTEASGRIEKADKAISDVRHDTEKALAAVERIANAPNGLFRHSVPKDVKGDIKAMLADTFPEEAPATEPTVEEADDVDELLESVQK